EGRIEVARAHGALFGKVAALQGRRALPPFLPRPAGAAANVGRAGTARNHVIRQRATDDGGRAAQVVDGAAEVVEAHAGHGLVVAQGAAGHAQAGAAASLKIAPPPPPPRPVLKLTVVLAELRVSKLSVMLRLACASLKMAPPPRPPTTV